MPQSPHFGTDRARLAAKLRELRAVTGMSGSQFAKKLGWPQSRVSKIETGIQFPTDTDIANWLKSAGVGTEDGTVAELLARARVESVSYRHEYSKPGGANARQQSIRDLQQQATLIAVFQPTMIPGLLQTAAFARELLSLPSGPAILGASPDDIEQMVATRIERQNLLYDHGKTLSIVLGEAALWTRIGTLETHLGQLDRLRAIDGLRSVDLRIVPFTEVMPCVIGGFELLDDRFVVVESITGEHVLADPEEIEVYERSFRHLQDAAVTGDEAAKLIQYVCERVTVTNQPD